LDIKSSNPQYELSSKGEQLLQAISSTQNGFNYAAFIDSYIEFKVSDIVFKELCTNGYFDIWDPGAPMKYFEGKSTGYLMVLRVYKLYDSVPEELLERGRSGRHFYYRLTEAFMSDIERPVLTDQEFEMHVNGLINVLKVFDSFVSVIKNDYEVLITPIEVYNETELQTIFSKAEKENEDLTLKEIAEKIREKKGTRAKRIQVTSYGYYRDPDVSSYAKKRANSICECCNTEAPFTKDDGTPFLETHHLIPLSEGGKDSIDNVCAVCPNCHRRLHFGLDKDTLTMKMIKKIYSSQPLNN
jgi:5-methylcytosine-specific restriction endonuclease McrA